MSWLLDADVLSQPAKSKPDPRVMAWLEAQKSDCYTSSIVIGQLAYWVRSKEGGKRIELQRWLSQLLRDLEGRVYGFNVAVAHVWAEQQRAFDVAGRRMRLADSLMAATARKYDLIIATGNDKGFRRPGLKVFNPFKA